MKIVRIIHCAQRTCTRFGSFPTLAELEPGYDILVVGITTVAAIEDPTRNRTVSTKTMRVFVALLRANGGGVTSVIFDSCGKCPTLRAFRTLSIFELRGMLAESLYAPIFLS